VSKPDKHDWKFNGDVNCPTFEPSVKITGKLTVKDAEGNWTGEWVRDKDGKAVDCECHYVLTKGIICYDNSSTHSLRGQKIPLPVLPPFLHD